MYADVYVKAPNQIPAQEHFALFGSGAHYIPGDERSRTNPGHGYPERTEHFIEYEAYLTKEKLLEAVKERLESKKAYRVARVVPLTVETTVDVRIH